MPQELSSLKLRSSLSALRLGLLVLVVAMTAGLGAGMGRPSAATAVQDIGLPLFGVTLSTAPSTAAPAYAQNVGAGFAVVHIDWTELEPTEPAPGAALDAAATARLDVQFSELASRGVVPVAGVGGAPPWAAPHRNGPLLPDKKGAYVAFLGKVVDRYKNAPYNVRHWLLWSEADAISTPPAEWSDRGAWADNPAYFADVMRDSYAAVKQRDAGAVVVMGSLAHDWFFDPAPGTSAPATGGTSPGFNQGGIFRYRFLDDVLDAMLLNGGGVAFDALGLNTYITFAPGWESDADRRGVPAVDVAAKISRVRARLAARGLDVPIFVGEAGFWSAGASAFVTNGRGTVLGSLAASPQTQAEYVAKLYARARSAGAAAVTWFALEEVSATEKHGLVGDGGTIKPAFQAFNWAARALGTPARSMSPITLLTTVQGSVESYAFSGTGNCTGGPCYTIVAWATGSVTPTARVAAAPDLRAYDLTGAPVSAVGTDRGRYLFDLTASPIFFQRVNYSTLVPLLPRLRPVT
jgi:hypothetical protein